MTNPAAWKPTELKSMQKPGYTLVKAPFILCSKDHPCTALAGEIVANWSNCDWLLVEIFAYLTAVEGWLAAELLQEIRNPRARAALVVKAAEKTLGSIEAGRINKKVLQPLLKLANDRNNIAHANWETSAAYPDSIIAVTGWGKDQKRFLYRRGTLEALADELRKRWEPLLKLYWACFHASENGSEGGFSVPRGIQRSKFELSL